jgi:hypothetical protein
MKIKQATHSGIGQNRIYTPCMTVRVDISLMKIPRVHRIPYWKYRTYTVYDRTFPCSKYCTYTVYDRTCGHFPAENTVHIPYMTVLVNIFLLKIPYIHRNLC